MNIYIITLNCILVELKKDKKSEKVYHLSNSKNEDELTPQQLLEETVESGIAQINDRLKEKSEINDLNNLFVDNLHEYAKNRNRLIFALNNPNIDPNIFYIDDSLRNREAARKFNVNVEKAKKNPSAELTI